MNQVITKAIVLGRTNYQEADRILTLLTEDQGKVRALAKGVRRSKAKLAGGIEPLSINEIGFIRGRGDLATLTTARLMTHFGGIVADVSRTMLAYELLKRINVVVEDNAEPEYFKLAVEMLEGLNNVSLDTDLLELWFDSQLLKITGHTPNISHDRQNKPLQASMAYMFDLDNMQFNEHPEGIYGTAHIKLLRLALSKPLETLQNLTGCEAYLPACQQLIGTMRKNCLHV